MGRDFITTIFYGYFLPEKDVKILEKKFESDDGEEDGFFMFGEKLDKQKDRIEAISVEKGTNNGDDLEYRYALAVRKSVKRMYLNEKSEYHRVRDVTNEPNDEDWDFQLDNFRFHHGLSPPVDIDWWISVDG